MHRTEELKYKLAALKDLAAKASAGGSFAVRRLNYQVLCDAAVALVLAHERVAIPALRSMAWKDVRSDALVAYATFRQSVAALLPVHAEDAEAGARIAHLREATESLEALGAQSIWPVVDQAVTANDPTLELQLEQALQTRDRTYLPADDPPAKQLLDDAALILSSFPTGGRPRQGR